MGHSLVVLLELLHLIFKFDTLFLTDVRHVLLFDKLAIIHLLMCQSYFVFVLLLFIKLLLRSLLLDLLMEFALERGL